MTRRARFAFEVRDRLPVGEDGRPFGVHVGNVKIVDVFDAREYPHADYLGSLHMTSEQYAALAGELAGVEAVRALHLPCHVPGTLADLCGPPHPGDPGPKCMECGKAYPCPTTEVLPS